jgi:hypothetical protein
MTLVTAKCAHCQKTDSVPSNAMLVEVSADEQPIERIGGRVCWICSTCTDVVGRELDWHELAVLLAAGAQLIHEDISEVLPPHPEAPPTGAPFTLDDLLELHERLALEQWVEQLTTRAV